MDDHIVYGTARAAMLWYCGGLVFRLRNRNTTSRTLWALGAAAMAAHVVAAICIAHGGSHAAAAEEITRRTAADVGATWAGGIWVNYAFAAVWAADAAWWCGRPQSYRARPRWLSLAVHAFLAFIAFNATVVFAAGPVRWAGIAATAVAVVLLFWRASGGRPQDRLPQ